MDLVVTVPKWFWPEWIAEGDAAGEPPTGTEWGFFMGGRKPPIGPGDRLYIVAHNRLRGYAPVTRLGFQDGKWAICREAGSVAVTIPEAIKGFQGFRRPWWQRHDEIPFPDWKTKEIDPSVLIFKSQQAANDFLPKCPRPKNGQPHHWWYFDHERRSHSRNFLNCMCGTCGERMKLNPDNPDEYPAV